MVKLIHILPFVFLVQAAIAQSPAIPEKLKQVDEFVSHLKENEQQAIYDMSFHTRQQILRIPGTEKIL